MQLIDRRGDLVCSHGLEAFVAAGQVEREVVYLIEHILALAPEEEVAVQPAMKHELVLGDVAVVQYWFDWHAGQRETLYWEEEL